MVATVGSIAVDLSVKSAAFEAALKKSATTVERESARMAKSAAGAERSLNSLMTVGKSLAASYAVKQVIDYADAWTLAGNRIRAASEVAGRQARGLRELNDIATGTRSGLEETVALYSKLLTATKDVAKSEEEVALATEILNKAFKAGGAAASEQAAGILQLAQALSSGVLQGDELRSLRENAPLVAQAIADEFKTTIGGLKDLGAEGELTAARVFKAILAAQENIDKAFVKTEATIGDGLVRVRNAGIELIGTLAEVTGGAKLAAADLALVAGGVEALGEGIANFAENPSLRKFIDDIIFSGVREGSFADRLRESLERTRAETDALNKSVEALGRTAQAAGKNGGGAIDSLVKSADNALKNVDAIGTKIDSLHDKTVNITVVERTVRTTTGGTTTIGVTSLGGVSTALPPGGGVYDPGVRASDSATSISLPPSLVPSNFPKYEFASGGVIHGGDTQQVQFFKNPNEAVGVFTPAQMDAIGNAMGGTTVNMGGITVNVPPGSEPMSPRSQLALLDAVERRVRQALSRP